MEMIDTRLVLFDGIPGSGKSTTAQRLYLHLKRLSHDAIWFYEHDQAHPILRPEERSRLLEDDRADSGRILKEQLWRWQALADSLLGGGSVTILDGAFFQIQVGLLMLLQVGVRSIVRLQLEVEACIAPLNPVLIYFRRDDIGRAIKAICRQRRDDSFAQGLVELIAHTPYGASNEVRDLKGVIAFFKRKQEIVAAVIEQLGITRLAIETSAGRWEKYERRITRLLSLPEMTPFDEVADPAIYAGKYRSAGESDDLDVTAGPNGICLNGQDQKRLIPIQDRTFLLEATCLELTFEEDEQGAIGSFYFSGPLELPEREWTKVA